MGYEMGLVNGKCVEMVLYDGSEMVPEKLRRWTSFHEQYERLMRDILSRCSPPPVCPQILQGIGERQGSERI